MRVCVFALVYVYIHEREWRIKSLGKKLYLGKKILLQNTTTHQNTKC